MYTAEQHKDTDFTWLLSQLKRLAEEQFYGKLSISFENGKISVLRKEETLKPPNKVKG